MKILRNDFETYGSELEEKWLSLMLKKKYSQAIKLCTSFIEEYKPVLKGQPLDVDETEYNKLLILLVLFKGLHEYVQLCQTTKNRNWHENNETVEYVWIKLCDCRERLEFSLQYCQAETIDRVLKDLDGLEDFFQDLLGDSNYLSPGIVSDRSLCSICQQDTRACSHIAGRLYNGKICFYQPVNPIADHVALVKIPKDPRCRIWPWHIKNNDEDEGIIIENACILTSFRVDDFLQDL